MARYYQDGERRRVAALMDAEVERAREAEKEGGWITYLIRDPRVPDRRGNPAGTPIYVGQSKEFGKRVRSRFDKCEKAATNKDRIEKRVADLLHQGIVVRYEVLERVPTRLQSLVSETNWARRCVRRRYDIANGLELQRVNGPPITAKDVPSDWIAKFLLGEAVEDKIVFDLNCLRCRIRLPINISCFARLRRPPKSLFEIKSDPMWTVEPCTHCGQIRSRYGTFRTD
jgi:hypothetical protein